ncbi:LPXTG cell wall anchor domain-containing protein [Streptococcus sp. ZJ93]|uniref:LPXTG cell wall anchor domain-containing protein n=1 Tax=Streptococcus handemini TaxID=3161188 RepID=UPI0034D3E65D
MPAPVEMGREVGSEVQTQSYSRKERYRKLPETGVRENIALMALGAVVSSLGLVTMKRKTK